MVSILHQTLTFCEEAGGTRLQGSMYMYIYKQNSAKPFTCLLFLYKCHIGNLTFGSFKNGRILWCVSVVFKSSVCGHADGFLKIIWLCGYTFLAIHVIDTLKKKSLCVLLLSSTTTTVQYICDKFYNLVGW